jgi:2,3-bisphosphoglycerate-dependent phosphoglycerate mutase
MSESVPPAVEGFRQARFVAPPGATTILLVRHGESAAAIAGEPFPLKDGHGDPALHPAGVAQAERVGERLQSERIDAIYVSSLIRTHQTAAPLAAAIGVTPVEYPDLREVFLGDWEGGLLRVKAAAMDPIYLRMRTEERWDVIPGAETSAQLSKRLWGALDQIVADHSDGRVAVFIHGAAIGQILADITGAKNSFAFSGTDNGSISEIVIDGPSRTLRRFNDTAHL